MNLRHIAFQNLRRRKAKAVFILLGLVTGVATVVTLLSFAEGMRRQVNDNLEKYGANILVVPKTENLSLTYGGLSLGGVSFEMQEIREEDLKRIKSIKNAANVAALGPLVLGVVEVNGRKVLLSGVDFQPVNVLKPWWRFNGDLPLDGRGVVVGSAAAAALGIALGDSVNIRGRTLAVSGVLLPTGSQDDQLLFTALGTAQELLGMQGRISMAEVAALCKDCPVEEMVKQISDVIPGARVMAIQQVLKGRMQTLQQFEHFSYGVSGVVILIGGLVVLVTMMGSVRERTEEIGIFRAIGFRRRHVMKIVFLEAAIISALAGALGSLIGFGGAGIVFRFLGKGAAAAPGWELAAGAVCLAVAVGLAASVYPALMAARLDPNEALRAL